MPSDAQRRLGRGLSALLGDESEDYAKLDRLKTSRSIGIDQLRPGRFQPRRRMTDTELDELAESIAAKGILQPLLVRRIPDDHAAFEIVAGERRWRSPTDPELAVLSCAQLRRTSGWRGQPRALLQPL